MAAATSVISATERAHKVTCAPAWASAAAAARPIPRPAPVTRTRRPSSLDPGDLGSSTTGLFGHLGTARVGYVSTTVTPHPDVRLLRMARESLQRAKP